MKPIDTFKHDEYTCVLLTFSDMVANFPVTEIYQREYVMFCNTVQLARKGNVIFFTIYDLTDADAAKLPQSPYPWL